MIIWLIKTDDLIEILRPRYIYEFERKYKFEKRKIWNHMKWHKKEVWRTDKRDHAIMAIIARLRSDLGIQFQKIGSRITRTKY